VVEISNFECAGSQVIEISLKPISRRFPFERVAAADQKAIFDMGFFMADVRPSLPTVSAEDQRLVFELLKGHLCLEVSAVAQD
jgi:hypothetical protein